MLIAHPAIGAVLAAEAVLGEMLAVAEQLDLLRFDLGQVVWMHACPPEIRVLEILVGAVAQHMRDVGADEGRGEIAAGTEAINHRRCRAEQERESRACFLSRGFGLLPLGDVGPRAGDLDRHALLVADNVLAIVHPEIGTVLAPDAILDRPLVALRQAIDPGIDARDIVRVNAVTPKIRVADIFGRRAAEQPGDAVADEGRFVIAGCPPAVDHGRRGVQQA